MDILNRPISSIAALPPFSQVAFNSNPTAAALERLLGPSFGAQNAAVSPTGIGADQMLLQELISMLSQLMLGQNGALPGDLSALADQGLGAVSGLGSTDGSGGGGSGYVGSSGGSGSGGYSAGTSSSGAAGGSAYTGGPTSSGPVAQGTGAMLDDARSMLGMTETGNTNEIMAITGKSGINPATTPWCSAFAINMMKDHGVLDTEGLSNPNYVPTVSSWAAEKGIRGTPGQYTPKAGDAIMFDWNGDGTEDHIGLVEKVENGKVYTIEGNSSDSVKANSYSLSDGNIAGYVKSSDQDKGKSGASGGSTPAPAKAAPGSGGTTAPKPKS